MKYALASALVLVAGAAAADAQDGLGLARHHLQRHDLSISGREVVQARIDIPPGGFGPRHSHPGEEVIYVVAGAIDYQIDGHAPVRVHAGEAFFIPAGAVHSAHNAGSVLASEIATYIVEKGKPLLVPAR